MVVQVSVTKNDFCYASVVLRTTRGVYVVFVGWFLVRSGKF